MFNTDIEKDWHFQNFECQNDNCKRIDKLFVHKNFNMLKSLSNRFGPPRCTACGSVSWHKPDHITDNKDFLENKPG